MEKVTLETLHRATKKHEDIDKSRSESSSKMTLRRSPALFQVIKSSFSGI
jgi:hypothetical protein